MDLYIKYIVNTVTLSLYHMHSADTLLSKVAMQTVVVNAPQNNYNSLYRSVKY